jgi:hypothetical protein
MPMTIKLFRIDAPACNFKDCVNSDLCCYFGMALCDSATASLSSETLSAILCSFSVRIVLVSGTTFQSLHRSDSTPFTFFSSFSNVSYFLFMTENLMFIAFSMDTMKLLLQSWWVGCDMMHLSVPFPASPALGAHTELSMTGSLNNTE